MDFQATAHYEYIEYEIEFDLDSKGGLDVGEPLECLHQRVRHNAEADSPQVLPDRQQIFIGWDTDFRKVANDLNIKALYQSWAPLDLFFSEYIEGESNNKALEIYNPTSQDIDLAAGGYKVCMYFNYGDGGEAAYTHTLEIPLTGTIKAHKTYVLKHSEANLISYPEDQNNGAGWFNGNDRVVLMRETDVIDEIGKYGENPDPNEKDNVVIVGWKMRDVQTGNRTLVRKPWVCRGVIHDDLPFFDPSAQWTVYKVNTFDNLGSHHCSVVHLVTFDPNGGEVESGDLVQSVYSGDNATAPTLEAPEGYTLAGWNQSFTNVQSDLKVAASWTANQYTVSFNSRGGSAVSAIPATYDEPYGDLPEPTRTGYNFEGWFDAEESGNEITSDTILKTASNHTLYAQWGINSYTLSFDSMEGSDVSPITQDYGTLIYGPDDPVRTGYTFLGWDPALPDTMPAKNMTLEAQWELNTYTITFDTGGGSKIAPMTVDYGATIVPPASPVWYCCRFKGWNPALPATMPAGDLAVKALWEVNAYTIIFDSAGGSFIPPLSQDYGSPISPPKDPVRTGYTFLGWEPALPDTMPMAGMEVEAQWQINQYRLIFDSDGGSPLAPQVLDYGSEIKAPVNPLRLGYRFLGWAPALPDRMGAADMTVKALWQRVGLVEGEDDETPGQGTPGTEDKPGSGQGSDLDRVPSTGENLPMTESIAFLGLAVLLLLAWRRRLLDLKKGKEEQT